jgi:hypothetical protein
MLIPIVSEAREGSARGRVLAVRARMAACPHRALTWFGILLDAARTRNRIGQQDKAREDYANRAARVMRPRPRRARQR